MSTNSTGKPFNRRRSRGRQHYNKEGEYLDNSRRKNCRRPRYNQKHFTKFHDDDRDRVYDNNWSRDSGPYTNRIGSEQGCNPNLQSEQQSKVSDFNNANHSRDSITSRYHSAEKETVSGAETGANNSKDKISDIVVNIKQENESKAAKSLNTNKKKSATTSSSSSSSSSDSDSADSDIKKLKKVVVNKILAKDKTNEKSLEPVVKKASTSKVAKPSSDESSDSDSSSDEDESNNKQKPKHASEEDVICLGKVENIENLVDDDEESGEKEDKICILCDKKGHTSFNCQMICKNCGAQYHNLKTCPETANVSVVLQNFMEFCMNQFYQYNPKEKFAFKNDLHSRVPLMSFPRLFSSEYEDNEINQPRISKRKHHANRSHSSIEPSVSSKHSKKKLNTSDSDSSLDENFSRRRKQSKRNNSVIDNNIPTMPSYSTNLPFTGPFPFPFNPQSLAFNPMLGFSQMMGFNPAVNFANTLTKDK